MLFDLHTHSTASDGTLTPAQLVRLAHESGLRALALTDHDTTAGLPEAAATATPLGFRLIPGIEVTAAHPRPGTMHLLGYNFDEHHPAMQRLLTRLTAARRERTDLILDRLRSVGVDLTLADVVSSLSPAPATPSQAGSDSSLVPPPSSLIPTITRPHLARLLVARGHATSTRDAFDRFLGGSGVAYVDTAPLAPDAVIAAVNAAGGLVSLAHPLQLRRRDFAQLEAQIRELADQGLGALEAYHSTHDLDTTHRLTRLADRLDLRTTGGSDFHNPLRGIRLAHPGGRPIPESVYASLATALATPRAA
jgi:hypothetical protein